jgi:hypothetical protein
LSLLGNGTRKQGWRDQKRKSGKWRNVEVYDSSDLEAWLEVAPGVDAWLAERLQRRPPGVVSAADHWERLSRLFSPRLKPEVFLASPEETARQRSRRTIAEQLGTFFLGPPGVLLYQCRSPIEAIDFAAAYLALTGEDDAEIAMNEEDRIRTQSRTVIVSDRAQWEGLSQTTGPLNLLPVPSLALSPEEQNAAVSRGHRVVIAATQFSSHRSRPIELPRPSRHDLERALRNCGFPREEAARAARAAGGSLSVLKRHLSVVPIVQTPAWCNDDALPDFLPVLLVGAWDDANEIDRTVLSRLSGRSYGELQNVANRLLRVEDAPLTRIESRWRLVSPEDSWWLVGEQVTDDLLRSFETIATEILSQEDKSLDLSADDRIAAPSKARFPRKLVLCCDTASVRPPRFLAPALGQSGNCLARGA